MLKYRNKSFKNLFNGITYLRPEFHITYKSNDTTTNHTLALTTSISLWLLYLSQNVYFCFVEFNTGNKTVVYEVTHYLFAEKTSEII